ncbi:hypothetical protein DOY81_004644, partial [Sarcophaga bullata]
MFKYIILAALLACAYASSEDAAAEVKSMESDVRADGFLYRLAMSNGIDLGAEGDEHGNIHGHYEYISPEGQHIRVDYVANENGYQPVSDVLPTPPPTPEAILKALEYLKAHPYFLIASLIAFAAADSNADDVHAEATLMKSDVRKDGFDWAMDTSNKIHEAASGDEHGNIHGEYEYVSPEGVVVKVLIATLIALAAADSHPDDVHAEATVLKSDVRKDGFERALETSNHIHEVASGDEHGNIHGNFGWVTHEGEKVEILLIGADEMVVVLALVAAVAAVGSEEAHAEIKSLESKVTDHGFHYSYETTNHISAAAEGDEHGNIKGNFYWISPEDKHVDISYVANEYGYQPSGDVVVLAFVAAASALGHIGGHGHS